MSYTTPTQSLAVTTTSIQSTPITSTRVRVNNGNTPVFYAVGPNPTAFTTGNCELIPANTVRSVNMQGLNNIIAFATASGTSNVSVVTIGQVAPSGIAGPIGGNIYTNG
jgi:hypothetical protein